MIAFKNVDSSNYKSVIQLGVTEEQESFVASNSYSLLEANYEEQHYPLAIYEQEELVGFLMYAFYSADEEYPKDSWWVLRLMIDSNHQKKGYGRQAIEEFEKYFKKNYDVKELRISAEPANHQAIELYEKMGFKKTGETVEGEIVLLKIW
jgi:diamine N-acetyltransferase